MAIQRFTGLGVNVSGDFHNVEVNVELDCRGCLRLGGGEGKAGERSR